MITIINGGYRTGSTLVYTLIQDMHIISGHQYKSGVIWHDEILEKDDTDNDWVIKSHNWLPEANYVHKYKTIYTRRNLLDVYSSFVKIKHNLDPLVEVKHEQTRNKHMVDLAYRFPDNVLILDYEDFYNDLTLLIKRLCLFLNVEIDNYAKLLQLHDRAEIKKMTDNLLPGNTTPYAPHHISNDPTPLNYINVLDQETIKKVVQSIRNDVY